MVNLRHTPTPVAATRLLVVSLAACCGACIADQDAEDVGRSTKLPVPSDATPDRASRNPPSPFEPLSEPVGIDHAKAVLGEALFHDKRLSADNTLSCATCHDLERGGVDHRRTSLGIGGAEGSVNAPTVFNAALNFSQFWDGRAASLEDQANGPPLAPNEMGSSWPQILAKLGADGRLAVGFKEAFADGLTAANVRAAIATFERTLITANAPFDRFLNGDTAALSPLAQRGFELFSDVGCVACHQGRALGGNMYQRFGVMGDYFADRDPGAATSGADVGRYAVTHLEADRHVFKVPGLRNVARTAPYFHDGSASTLQHAVHVMARYQLGRTLTEDEVAAIVAFLESLTGEYQGRPL